MKVYGADKVWKQLHCADILVACGTVERLMRRQGWQGARRSKRMRTMMPDSKAPCPLDRLNRRFSAERPNRVWVTHFTYASTWQGFACAAFVIDVYARFIAGWRVTHCMRTDVVLDALE